MCCLSPGSTLSLPGLEESRGYIQCWGAGEIQERTAQRIFHAANSILKAGTVDKTIDDSETKR